NDWLAAIVLEDFRIERLRDLLTQLARDTGGQNLPLFERSISVSLAVHEVEGLSGAREDDLLLCERIDSSAIRYLFRGRGRRVDLVPLWRLDPTRITFDSAEVHTWLPSSFCSDATLFNETRWGVRDQRRARKGHALIDAKDLTGRSLHDTLVRTA